MLRGLYSAAAGMITQQRVHDTVTNNIANMNTPGYKQGNAVARSFPEMLISLVGGGGQGPEVKRIGRLHSGVFAEEAPALYKQGDLMETDNPYDFALVSDLANGGLRFDPSGQAFTPEGTVEFQPQAYFTVQNADGEIRYTRNGKFTVDSLGQLVTSNGDLVLGQDQRPVTIGQNVTGIRTGSRGELLDAGTGQALLDANGTPNRLLISKVDNPNDLIAEGNDKFYLNAGMATVPFTPEDNYEVRQGYIERSNVDPAQSMVELMAAQRAYEANQKVVQFYDKSLDKAVNEVGRV